MGEAPVTGNVRKLIDDPSFPNQWQVKEEHLGHKVLWKDGVSKEYGVHGTAVGTDFDICIADGICITVCPTNVFDRMDIPSEQEKMDKGTPNDSGKALLAIWKADPARNRIASSVARARSSVRCKRSRLLNLSATTIISS